jgi:hypothetical protein
MEYKSRRYRVKNQRGTPDVIVLGPVRFGGTSLCVLNDTESVAVKDGQYL